MSFLSGGGGSSERMPDYMPGQSPPEMEARRQADAMLGEQRRQTDSAIAETERLKGIEADKAAKVTQEAALEEDRRQKRLTGGGIQRFMTAGYSGYGDSRALGTAMTLGG